MKEKLGATLAAASVLVAGCATESTPPKITEIESVATFPGTLPPAVSQQLGNVVAIQSVRLKTTNIKDASQQIACSGVRVGERDILSAGSCDYNQPVYDQQQYCDITGVNMSLPGQAPTDPPKGASYLFGKMNGIAPAPNITDFTKMTENTLVGEIAQQAKPPAYDTPTHYAASPVMVPVGTQLYLANYEKTADGKKARNPDPDFNNFTPDDIKAGLTKPVIMGAIALKQSPNGVLQVLTGIKSYDDSKETQLRGGDSGGPIWNAAGELIGTIITDDSSHKISDYEKALHIDLPGLSDDMVANVGIVQLINPPRIRDLQAHEVPPQSC